MRQRVSFYMAGPTPPRKGGSYRAESGFSFASGPSAPPKPVTPPPVAARFEARLGARLSGAATPRDAVAWALRHPGRLIVTGAVGSAVGVGVTAYAVWRSSRRTQSGWFLHR